MTSGSQIYQGTVPNQGYQGREIITHGIPFTQIYMCTCSSPTGSDFPQAISPFASASSISSITVSMMIDVPNSGRHIDVYLLGKG